MRRILYGLPLVVLYGCKPEPPAAPEKAGQTTAVPSQEIDQFNLQDIRGGLKSMSLVATVARVFEAENYAQVTEPLVTFYALDAKNAETSHLKSPIGRVDLTTHAVEAWGGVTVITADSTTLKTERLRYDPAIRKILSDSAVELTRPGTVTRGIGLESDPELKRVIIRKQRGVMSETQ